MQIIRSTAVGASGVVPRAPGGVYRILSVTRCNFKI
jgi:hypothetical protein